MSNNTKSIFYALVAVLSWSTVATAFKITLRYLTYFDMLLIASATALLFFAFVLTIQRKWNIVQHLTLRQWRFFALLGILNPVAYYLVLFKAYESLPAQVAQPINYTWPFILLVMLALFSGKKIHRGKYIGIVLSFFGVTLISLGKSDSCGELSLAGIILGFLSAVLWATYWMVNNRKKDDVDGNVALFLSFLFGTLYLMVATIFVDVHLCNTEGILSAMYIGCFEMGLPFVFFAMALRTTTNPVIISQMSYISPFLSLFIISIFLAETIALTTIVGLILIVLGIVLNEFVFIEKNETT